MNNQEEMAFYQLSKKDYTLKLYLLSMLAMALGCWFGEALTIYVSVILFFTCFDCYGYEYLLTRHNKLKEATEVDYNQFKIAYRIMQGALMFTLGLILILVSIIWELTSVLFIATALTWWFGFCDYLFYKILKQNEIWQTKDFTWLAWTPYGIYLRIVKKPIEGKYFIWFSSFAMILSVLAIIWFEYL